jgi:magnesium and cobalt exporter, CNNM family
LLGPIIGLICLILLICMAAFFAASETALMRVSRIRVRYLAEKKQKNAVKLEKLIENPDRFYPSILLAALVVQLSSASLATWITTRLTNNAGIGFAVGTAVITALMFIFGELVPKAGASHQSERVALRVTGVINFTAALLRPVAVACEWIARNILRGLGVETRAGDELVTEEGEIKALVSAAEERAVIEEEEKEMIHSVFEFSDTLVREVMVPRPDMVTLPAEASVKDAVALAVKRGYSRIPVYRKEVDNVVGVLYAKDLLRHMQEGKLSQQVGELIRPAIFIPETKVLSDLLKDFQSSKVHIGIVIDEYGTVVGLVTIEDLLEEIVGEIFDEFDREVSLIEKLADGRYRVDARMNLEDLGEILKLDLPEEEDVDSVGGLVLKVLGHVPVEGETFVYNNISMKVEKLRNNRISKVLMEPVVVPDADEELE